MTKKIIRNEFIKRNAFNASAPKTYNLIKDLKEFDEIMEELMPYFKLKCDIDSIVEDHYADLINQ